MKKIYSIPAIEVVKIQTTNLLAGSPDGFLNAVDNTTGVGGSAALAPEFDVEEDIDLFFK